MLPPFLDCHVEKVFAVMEYFAWAYFERCYNPWAEPSIILLSNNFFPEYSVRSFLRSWHTHMIRDSLSCKIFLFYFQLCARTGNSSLARISEFWANRDTWLQHTPCFPFTTMMSTILSIIHSSHTLSALSYRIQYRPNYTISWMYACQL